MNEERRKILEMLSEGKITAEDVIGGATIIGSHSGNSQVLTTMLPALIERTIANTA